MVGGQPRARLQLGDGRHHLELHGRTEVLRGRKQSKADEPAPELSNSQTAETSPAW